MEFNSKPIVAAVLLALAVIGVAIFMVHSVPDDTPTEVQYRTALWRVIRASAGTHDVECGFVPLNAEIESAMTCARDQIASRASFWVAFQERGEDSIIWSALSGSSDIGFTVIVFDASLFLDAQREVEYSVSKMRCTAVEFSKLVSPTVRCADAKP
jgi:hypothetical protein